VGELPNEKKNEDTDGRQKSRILRSAQRLRERIDAKRRRKKKTEKKDRVSARGEAQERRRPLGWSKGPVREKQMTTRKADLKEPVKGKGISHEWNGTGEKGKKQDGWNQNLCVKTVWSTFLESEDGETV